MAFSIVEKEDGTYDWSVFASAYGAASGNQPTLSQAVVELAIGEAAVFENPYVPFVQETMRAEPDKFAASANFPEDHIKRFNHEQV